MGPCTLIEAVRWSFPHYSFLMTSVRCVWYAYIMTTLVARLLQAQINTFKDDSCLTKQQQRSLSRIKDIYGSGSTRRATSKAQEERDKAVRRVLDNIRNQLGFAAFLICALAISPSRLSKFRSRLDSDFRQWWAGARQPQSFLNIAQRLSQEPPWGTPPLVSDATAPGDEVGE